MMSDDPVSNARATDAETAQQVWQPACYATHARFVADLGAPLIELLAPRPGERILDLGCGDGVLTERLAQYCATPGATGAAQESDAGSASVEGNARQAASSRVDIVGADAAPDFVAAARQRGLDVRLADGHDLPFNAEFDAVFSNAALHWMTRPDDVIAGVRRALRPGGRFVGEFGGHGNVAAVVVALRAVMGTGIKSPWYYPTPEEYTRRLEAHGFTVDSIALIPRPTPLPTDLGGWLDTFAGTFLNAVPPADRLAARDAVVELLAPVLRDSDGRWTLDYVRLRFAAHLA